MVSVEFETPIEKVTQALEETLEEIKANHPVYGKMIKSPLKFLGVHESFEHGYTYVCSVRTSPDPSGDFVYEFYRQWKVTSDKHHISQPVQRQQVEVLRDLTKETD